MRLQFSRLADHDLDRLRDFLITNKATLKTADKAILTIKDSAKLLKDNPELGTSLNDDMGRRDWPVKYGKNGYVIRYVLDYEAKFIRILRIWHSREDRE